jgi:hypothetical protein
MDQKAAQGGWPVRAPFGYRNVRRDGPGRRGESVLEPDPQAPLVVTIRVRDGAIADFTYEEPFGSLLGSHKGSMVEMMGLEPTTPCLQSRCSSS